MHGRDADRTRIARRGFTYLEVSVASIIFALTLAGLGATIIAQERLMQAVERRVVVLAPPGVDVEVTQFLSPHGYAATRALEHPGDSDILQRTDTWAARLGAGAVRSIDGRRGHLSAAFRPSPWALGDDLSWVPENLSTDPPTPAILYDVALKALADDGATSTASVSLSESTP